MNNTLSRFTGTDSPLLNLIAAAMFILLVVALVSLVAHIIIEPDVLRHASFNTNNY